MINKKFELTLENFPETVAQIDAELSNFKATKKESMNAQLLLEETFMRMVNIGKAEAVQVKISKRFGDLILQMENDGEEYNPLVSVTDFDENDEDYFRTLILKANSEKMSYARKNRKNFVSINVHESDNKQLHYTIFAMVTGLIFGAICKFAMPPEFCQFFDQTISGNFIKMFMNALGMLIAPLVFLSIISGITGMTNAADTGRIGGKLVVIYSLTTIAATIFALSFAMFLFSSGVPQVGIVEGDVSTDKFSILSVIVGIVPENLLNPILNRNLLQIIFVAVLFGICINKLGNKIKPVSDLINAANTFFLTVVTVVAALIPVMTFFAMASLVIGLGVDSLMLLGKLVFGIVSCDLLMILLYWFMIKFFGKISATPFVKKLPQFVPIPIATCSSSVTMPFTMKFCTEKLGISPKLSSFSIPLGATINMNGTAITISLACIMFMEMYGIEISANEILALVISIYTISVGCPGIPNVGIIVVAAIIGSFGIPADAATTILGVMPIIDRVATTTNVVGDIASTVLLAKNENLLDEKIYAKM